MAKYYSLFGGTTTDTEIQVAKENQIVIHEGPGAFTIRYVIYKVCLLYTSDAADD